MRFRNVRIHEHEQKGREVYQDQWALFQLSLALHNWEIGLSENRYDLARTPSAVGLFLIILCSLAERARQTNAF